MFLECLPDKSLFWFIRGVSLILLSITIVFAVVGNVDGLKKRSSN